MKNPKHAAALLQAVQAWARFSSGHDVGDTCQEVLGIVEYEQRGRPNREHVEHPLDRRGIALARVQVRRDGEIAGLGKAAASPHRRPQTSLCECQSLWVLQAQEHGHHLCLLVALRVVHIVAYLTMGEQRQCRNPPSLRLTRTARSRL